MLRAFLSILHLFQLQSLQTENTSLRRQVTTNQYQSPSCSEYPDPSSPSSHKRRQSSRASRPMSMYETGSGLKPYVPKGEMPYPEEALPTLQPFPPHVSKTCSLHPLLPVCSPGLFLLSFPFCKPFAQSAFTSKHLLSHKFNYQYVHFIVSVICVTQIY